jgi:hypothetical protein
MKIFITGNWIVLKNEIEFVFNRKTPRSMRFFSCSHPSSSNSRIQIEHSNKSQTSSISQYQSMRPLISTEINASSKVNFFVDIQNNKHV